MKNTLTFETEREFRIYIHKQIVKEFGKPCLLAHFNTINMMIHLHFRGLPIPDDLTCCSTTISGGDAKEFLHDQLPLYYY